MNTDERQQRSNHQRIAVVGTTGSGKTTLAQNLARLLGIPHVELDALHWGPNWTSRPIDVFRERAAQALSGDRWVVDGNYGEVRGVIWGRADTGGGLAYAVAVERGRLARRTLHRIVTQEVLWGGNREGWREQFFSRNSLFLWALQTYPRRRREYPALFARPEYAHLTVVRLRSPRAARDWLDSLT